MRLSLRHWLGQASELDEYSCLMFADAVERGEYFQAIDSLRRFFDRAIVFQAPEESEMQPELTTRSQYALLHLASIHATFGYTEEAVTALLECQEIAREHHDADCLKFCRMWLQNLEPRGLRTEPQRDAILGALVDSSRQNNLLYLQALGELTIARRALEQGRAPATFFASFARASAVISRPEKLMDSPAEAELLLSLRGPAQLLLMEAYRRYGSSSLAQSLDMTTDLVEASSDVITSSKLIARRAFDLIHLEGKWNEAEALIQGQMDRIRGHAPAEAELRKFWDAMLFERAVRRNDFDSLSLFASRIASSAGLRTSADETTRELDDLEISTAAADALLAADKVPEAFSLLCEVLALPSTTGPSTVPYLLKLASLHATRSSSPLTALPLILTSLTLCSRFYMVPAQLVASLKLASLLLHFRGLSQRSLDLCEQAIPAIVADGDQSAKGDAWLIHARCLISCAGDLLSSNTESGRELLENALEALANARQGTTKTSMSEPITALMTLHCLHKNSLRVD